MAAAYCATIATTSFHFPPARKSPLLISAMCTPFPSKGNNYLHPDILKTQAKPFPDPILPEIPPAKPLIPLESTLEQQRQPQVKESDPIEQQPPDIPSDQLAGEETKEFDPVGQQPKLSSNQFSSEEMKEYVPIKRKSGFDYERFLSQKIQQSQVREFSFSETRRSAELENGVAGNFLSPSQIGFGFVLACVIDVIWSYWMVNLLKSDKELSSGSLDGNKKPNSELSLKEEGNSIEIKNGGVVSVDESASDKMVVEIRELAREVREKEELESKGNDPEKMDDDVVLESENKKEVDD